MDSDPDIEDVNKNYFFFSKFFGLLLFEGTFTSFFQDKKSSIFFLLFLLDEDSGSERPENICIRIRNTDFKVDFFESENE
jgi:hypothetical protein